MVDIQTVTIEMSYEDALRLWVLVHDPENAGKHRVDERIRKLVHDAVGVVEDDYGAPAIDPKRPYGNGDVYRDMRKILGRPPVDEDHWGDGSDEADLLGLHKEMETVLQIGLRTGRFQAGEYIARRYFHDWRPS